MATGGVEVRKNIAAMVQKRIADIPRLEVLVGIPDSDSERRSGGPGSAVRRATGGSPQDITNPQLGYIHEFGAPERGIPARPFLIPGTRGSRSKWLRYLHQSASASLNGDKDKAERALHAAGMTAMSAVQRRIQEGIPPPLADATVARRRIRSKGSSYRRKATSASQTTPLIDTGQLLRALTYVVRKAADGKGR